MSLTDTAVRNARPKEKPQKLSDGGGLQLLVTPAGGKLWRLAYRFDGKQKQLALGAYPAITLSAARSLRDDAKALLAQGEDPGAAKKARLLASSADPGANSFNAIADELLAKMEREGRAKGTLEKKHWLLEFARQDFGSRPVTAITAAEVLGTLRKIEARGNHETARRVRSAAGAVFRYAIATARAENDPTSSLRGALTTPKVKHRAAITDPVALGGLLRAIRAYEGQTTVRIALELMALLYPRPGELRHARWSEFDLARRVWTIPADKTKMRREHRKPLPERAVSLLNDLRQFSRGDLVIGSTTHTGRPLSENTLNAALRRMGFTTDDMTSHGFRATASTLLNESRQWSADAIERELAHEEEDEVRRAYHRAEYWDERVRMTEWWASHLDSLRQARPRKEKAHG